MIAWIGVAVFRAVASTGPSTATARVSWILLISAGVLGVLVPLMMAFATGGLSIPHNDAWAYSRIAQTFATTGRLELLGWNRSALMGQIVVLGPLARSLVVQQVFVAALAGVALAAVYDLVVGTAGRTRAALAVLTVAIWPGFGLLATSFMPDVPAMAAAMVCLALGRRALRTESSILLAVSVAIGLWGFTIREQAIAAPVAVLLVAAGAAWRSRWRRELIFVAGVAAALVVVVAGFELWRQSLGAGDPPVLQEADNLLYAGGTVLAQGYFLLALAAVPAVLLVARPWRWGRTALVGSAVAGVVAVIMVIGKGFQRFFVGNYLAPAGPYTLAGNGHPAAIFPPTLWRLVVVFACASGVLLAGVLVRRFRQIDAVLGTFAVLFVLGNVAGALAGQTLYDRYWLPVLPPLLAVVLSEQVRTTAAAKVSAVAAISALSVVSLVMMASGLAYDSARWHAAQHIAATGTPSADVDGGLEWTGYHSPNGMVPAASWEFPGSRPCYLVTADEEPGRNVAMVWAYRPFLIAGRAQLWVYGPDCNQVRRH